MEGGYQDLQRRVARFEEELRAAWDLGQPGLPRHLRPYRHEWTQTLEAPLQPSNRAALQAALDDEEPLLVSDYHPSERSRRDLAAALQLLPPEQELVLALELLPQGKALSAAAALRDGHTRLVTGRLLSEAYRPALEVLAQRGGTVVGAWSDAQAVLRDRAAARIWAEAHRPGQRARWVFHFGDWHLAAGHLPARLREAEALPTILHLSPEPVWTRVGLHPPHHVLRLGAEADRHWVWLRTPPLGLCASRVADEADGDPAELAEGTEHLLEGMSRSWCAALGLPEPELRLSVQVGEDWEDFRALLPEDWRALLVQRPAQPVFHPRLPMLWMPGAPGLNTLLEGAQHMLLCDSPLRDAEGGDAEVLRQAWRSLGAALVNPFLRAQDWLGAARGLWPQGPAAAGLADRARAADPACGGAQAAVSADPHLALLQARVWGGRCGTALANWDALDADFLARFLQSAGGALEPRILAATLRAA